jgi:hypothetical protein
MKHILYILVIAIICLIASCKYESILNNEVSENFESGVWTNDSNAYLPIDSLLRLRDFEISSTGSNPCSNDTKQILEIKSFGVFYDNYKNTGAANSANRYIICSGKPTPNSCKTLTKANLFFVTKAENLKSPVFTLRNAGTDKEFAEISLYFMDASFETLYQRLTSKDNQAVYCWHMKYPSQDYGDLHFSYLMP